MNDASAPPAEKARPARGRAESPCGKRPVATAAPVPLNDESERLTLLELLLLERPGP